MPGAPVLSTDFSSVTLASETAEVLVCLVEIRHPSLTEPIRLTSDMAEIYGYDEDSGDPIYVTRSQGNIYFSMPFSFIPPGTPDEGKMPRGKFVIANADVRITQAIRNVHDRLTLKAMFVHASDPDTIISEIPTLWIESVDYDAASITATLSLKHFLNSPVPKRKFTPANFPALFKSPVSSTYE